MHMHTLLSEVPTRPLKKKILSRFFISVIFIVDEKYDK